MSEFLFQTDANREYQKYYNKGKSDCHSPNFCKAGFHSINLQVVKH